jgi:hypothetical protein
MELYQENRRKTLARTNIYIILFFLLNIIQPPFIFFSFFPSYYKSAIAVLLMILLGIFLGSTLSRFYHFKKITFSSSHFFLFYIAINLIYFCFCILLFDPLNIKYAISDIRKLIALSLSYLFFANLLKNIDYIKLYVNFMAILSTVNTIGYFLMLLGLLKPFSEFESAFSQSQDAFYNYVFFVVQKKLVTELSGFNLLRTCGYFDEPGTFGFFLTFAIILYHLFFPEKSKHILIEITLLIAGITTFSLGFYISIIIFYIGIKLNIKTVITYIRNILLPKKTKIWYHFFIIMLFPITSILINNDTFIGYLQTNFFSRLQFTGDEQIIAGNNRASGFTKGLPIFLERIWFGWGPGAHEYFRGEFVFASLAGPLVRYGLIGTIFIIHLPFFRVVFQFISLAKKEFIIAGFVLILNFLQRPFNFLDPLILLGLIFILNYYFSKKAKLS